MKTLAEKYFTEIEYKYEHMKKLFPKEIDYIKFKIEQIKKEIKQLEWWKKENRKDIKNQIIRKREFEKSMGTKAPPIFDTDTQKWRKEFKSIRDDKKFLEIELKLAKKKFLLKKLLKLLKISGGIGAGTAAVAGGAYLLYKNKNKEKQENKVRKNHEV